MATTPSDKILARLKGLRTQMREGEQPLYSIPAIWENATTHQSNACDLVLTNQRIFGYIYTTFPRERLFLDALELDAVTAVSIRQKSFAAMFRELLICDDKQRIYIRATSKKIEETYTALRSAISAYTSLRQTTRTASTSALAQADSSAESAGEQDELPDHTQANQKHQDEQAVQQHEQSQTESEPIYSRQRLRQSLERSPLGIAILFVGGLILEVVGILFWASLGNPQAGVTLILTGLFAVIIATLARRQLR